MYFFFKHRFPYKSRKNPYAILNIAKNADLPTIKAAYRQQVILLHPDKNPDLENYNGFLELQTAYETLSDPKKRSEYDEVYAYDDSIRRHFDPHITPDAATARLQEFFVLFFEKRGCSTAPSAIQVIQRKSNLPPHESIAFFKGIDRLFGKEREEFPYASWHYLQLHMSHHSIEERLTWCFDELHKSFSNDPFIDALTIEFREAQGDDETLGEMHLDIHLHNIELLERAIEQLKNENPHLLLNELVTNKLKENPKNILALAAKEVLNNIQMALNKKELSPCTAARISYLTHVTLQSPTQANIENCLDFIKKNEHGNANWWRIIGGSFLVFVGISICITSLICAPIGLSLALVATGIALLVSGAVLGYQGRKMGLARALNGFFQEATKQVQADIIPNSNDSTHIELPSDEKSILSARL